MVKFLWLLLQLQFALFFTASAFLDHHPHHHSPISIKSNQTETSCEYTVVIKTSCSSVSYTTDEISLAFGDAHGNGIYEPRIDDPNTRTFERCSTYVFEIRGTCLDVICKLFLMRKGSDGWKPTSVKIYGPAHKPLIFLSDTFLPDGIWYGEDACTIASSNSAFYNFAFF